MEYSRATTKAVATARMYYLGNRVVEPLGPGSKEKKSALVALGAFVDLDLAGTSGKTECGRLIAEKVGVEWDDSCSSTGDTITLEGLNRLLDGAVQWHVRSGRRPVRSLVRDLETINPAPRWDETPEDENMAADLTEIEANIAEHIGTLAEPGPMPEGVDASRSTEVSAESIRIEDGTWRSALSAVQGWLHLSGELDETSGTVFDRALADFLGVPTGATQEEFYSRLQERLERAVQLREAFLEDLDDESEGGSTRQTASARWSAAWDDVEETEEAETSGPIKARADVWPIAQFRQYAIDGALNLNPSYQRADVWPTGDAQQLMESILRGIPLPSVIILERSTEEGETYEIVDGKQRLTSILRFTASHPAALATVEQKAEEWDEPTAPMLFERDYPAFKKLWNRHERRRLTASLEKELYFPFPLRTGNVPALSGELTQVRGRYYSEIRNIVTDVAGARRKIQALFETVSDYRLPVILYQEATARQVHEVFSLYNKQGKHLNAEEIRNAAFHELDLMRALLVTAGDTQEVADVAPFLMDAYDDIASTGRNLSSYGFAAAGYKRTKTISWVAAALLLDDDKVESRSTATHINNLLKRVQEVPSDPLRSQARVTELMVLLDKAVDVHAAVPDEAWAPAFKNAQSKGRWQELQLVATLIALAAAWAVHGEDLYDLVDDSLDELSERSQHWRRPAKTQSKEQWRFIGTVVHELLDTLRVDVDQADATLGDRFGSSGLRIVASLAHESVA